MKLFFFFLFFSLVAVFTLLFIKKPNHYTMAGMYSFVSRGFKQEIGIENLTQQEVMAKKLSNKETHSLIKNGLITYWDFNAESPFKSKGKFQYELLPGNGEIEMKQEGILSNNSISIKEGQYLFIPRRNCKKLNIEGKKASVTILAWVKRQAKKRSECEAIAGMWNETLRKRQYCLFLNIQLNRSSDQVAGHISGVGGPTEGNKWCIDVAIGKQPVPFNEWTFVAFTYDGTQIKSYINGLFDERENNNPYTYEKGIFNGGEDGADFTVGAVHRLGEIGNNFVGQIGGLAIYNRALAAKEIKKVHDENPLAIKLKPGVK